MYLKQIELENTGPIDHLLVRLPLDAEGKPKPIILVGENGAGKTIFLAHIVNALLHGKQVAFEDGEVEQGKVYKYRSPLYIKSGTNYAYARLDFDDDQFVEEWQLDIKKKHFEDDHQFSPARKSFQNIPQNEFSSFNSSFSEGNEKSKALFDKQCCLYFPANRFEAPAWLNLENLRERANYTELKRVARYSNRRVIATSPLKENRDWLLDILLDRHAFEQRLHKLQLDVGGGQTVPVDVFAGYQGESTKLYEAITKVLRATLRAPDSVRIGVGTRRNRVISIMKDEKIWVPNIFQLSTGEVLLLNLFFSILRDFDLSSGDFENLSNVKGVVVVDEIDAHLHTELQREVLPELIRSFPSVQFIVTTHSPLFLIGMQERFGEDGFQIVKLPDGVQVSATEFSEFSAAYDAFKRTTAHRREIDQALATRAKPIVFVEGVYDIKYLSKAAELLGKQELLNSIQLLSADGFGNLDKIWRVYDSAIADALASRIMLLYDCDTKKAASDRGKVFKRVMPTINQGLIATGIENLLPNQLIEKLSQNFPHFIDISQPTQKRVRGQLVAEPCINSINKDEKGNLCDWICQNGTVDDFQNFSQVFQLIEETLLIAP